MGEKTPEEGLRFEMVGIHKTELEKRQGGRGKRLLAAALFFFAILFYMNYLHSWMNAPQRRCESFAATLETAFSGGSVSAVDVLFSERTTIGWQGRKSTYFEARRHIQSYFLSGGRLLSGSAGLAGEITVAGEKLFFRLEARGSFPGERQAAAGFRAELVMDGDGVTSVYSDDPLFGLIFFGVTQ